MVVVGVVAAAVPLLMWWPNYAVVGVCVALLLMMWMGWVDRSATATTGAAAASMRPTRCAGLCAVGMGRVNTSMREID